MASFEEILKRPAVDNKPPEAYPVGTYHCIVDGPPEVVKSAKKQTDGLAFKFKILKAMEDVDQMKAAEQQVIGKFITDTYWITDGAAYRLTDLFNNLGLDISKPSDQLMVEAPGCQLLVKLRHTLSDDGKRVFANVDSTASV